MGDFKTYFNGKISPNINKVSKWAIDKLTIFDSYSGITQNQSESMNTLLKSLNKWKEARAGLGNYNLKPQYVSAKIDVSDIVQFAVCQPEDIVNAIRENKFITQFIQEENEKTEARHPKVDINMPRADELI